MFIGVLKPLHRIVQKRGFPLRVREGSEYLLQIKVGRWSLCPSSSTQISGFVSSSLVVEERNTEPRSTI